MIHLRDLEEYKKIQTDKLAQLEKAEEHDRILMEEQINQLQKIHTEKWSRMIKDVEIAISVVDDLIARVGEEVEETEKTEVEEYVEEVKEDL